MSGREHDAPRQKQWRIGINFFTNSASNAVLRARKFFWPMGPISPLQKNPASPIGPVLFHQLGVVVWAPKRFWPRPLQQQRHRHKSSSRQLFFCARQQFVHVLGRRHRVAPLELHGLPRTRRRADGQHAGVWVAADEIAHEKSPRMKIFEIFIDDKANEQITRVSFAVQQEEVFGTSPQAQHRRGGWRFADQIVFDTCERPRSPMGVQPCEMTRASFTSPPTRNRHATVLEHITVQVDLGLSGSEKSALARTAKAATARRLHSERIQLSASR